MNNHLKEIIEKGQFYQYKSNVEIFCKKLNYLFSTLNINISIISRVVNAERLEQKLLGQKYNRRRSRQICYGCISWIKSKFPFFFKISFYDSVIRTIIIERITNFISYLHRSFSIAIGYNQMAVISIETFIFFVPVNLFYSL